jgi:uncharacterized protein (TIGR03083 family)
MISTPMTQTALAAEIAAERRDLADVLAALPAQAWDAPTLCAGWRVRELVAHVTMPFRYSTTRFAAELLRSGGNFTKMSDRCARRDAAIAPAELVSVLRDNAANPWQPPGGGLAGALTHDVIHGLDVVVPLGVSRRVPAERLVTVLHAVTGPKALGHFGADLTGIELRADDLDWSFGSGQAVRGPAQDLALVLCGRKLPAGRLRGDLGARFSSS